MPIQKIVHVQAQMGEAGQRREAGGDYRVVSADLAPQIHMGEGAERRDAEVDGRMAAEERGEIAAPATELRQVCEGWE